MHMRTCTLATHPNPWWILVKRRERRRGRARALRLVGCLLPCTRCQGPTAMTGEIVLLAMDFIRKTAPYVPVFVCITDYVGTICTVSGRSMQPTFNARPGGTDAVIIDKWTARSHSYRRGDVVVLKSPSNPMELMTKRVIGLGGDWVCGRDAERKMQPVRAPRPRCERTSRRDSGCRAHVSTSPREADSPLPREAHPRRVNSLQLISRTQFTHALNSLTHSPMSHRYPPATSGSRATTRPTRTIPTTLARCPPASWSHACAPSSGRRGRSVWSAGRSRTRSECSRRQGCTRALDAERVPLAPISLFFLFSPRYPRFVSCMHSANQEKPDVLSPNTNSTRIACGEAPCPVPP